jgi:hypothetical protein
MDMNCCKFCGKVLERDDDGDRYWLKCLISKWLYKMELMWELAF